jgi:TonB-dependent SusC/RagA subfamily outer membrane receptor
MMNKKQSNRINKGIYILLLPAIMCMVLILTNPKAALSNCQLGGVMVNLNEMPEIIGLKSDLIPQSTKPSNVALLQNKQNQTNNPTATVLPDTTKLKKAVIKFTAIADTIKTGEKKPLYIVDGIEFTGISNLNPENIASITVLKGASAMAKYGNTGSEGVIEITSKAAASNSQGNTIPPVSSNTIILRKAESEKSSFEGLSSNELIILNGKEADRSVLNDLKVMSVAKIVVFKGQKALSKFGEKGRNGVIQITTKPNK